MPVIYLRHKDHGEKVAIDKQEADADKERGWVEFNPYDKDEEQKPRRGRPRKNPEE